MARKFTKIHRIIAATLLTVSLCQNSYAAYDGERTTISYDGHRCETGPFKFDPFTTGSDNPDINWELDNPTCIAYMVSVGAAMVAADYAASIACKPTNPLGLPSIAAETASDAIPPPIPYITPGVLTRMFKHTSKCGARIVESSSQTATCATVPPTPLTLAACPGATLANTDVAKCCPAVAIHATTVGVAVGALAVIWDLGRIAYKNAKICGGDWQQWAHPTKDNDPSNDAQWVKGKGPYRICIEKLFSEGVEDSFCRDHYGITLANKTLDPNYPMNNKYYREYIYGGQEMEDNGDNACDNPTSWDDKKKDKALGYHTSKQRYYMTGPGVASIYACHRFLASDRDDQAAKIAYECCKKRSLNAICIESKKGLGSSLTGPYHNFCEVGSRCQVGDVTFDIYASRRQTNYVCAKTYSVCPYNHLLGGGTELQVMEENDSTKVKNFCQFMNHCSKTPVLPYVRMSNLEGGYISSACRDMKGDSQNVYGYSSGLIPINTRNFSAPMVQCFKETMENIFLHKAGDTKCINPDELPGDDEVCASGYVYKKGGDLPGKSFFIKIQDNVQEIIKMCLTIAVIVFGFSILIAVPGKTITKKELLPFILKIGIVMYFAVGDGWQFGFTRGVLGASGYLADITFRVDESAPASKLDGCQFPKYNYADESDSRYDNPSYPSGKEYLRIWDTLDCKIARALGFGPEVSVPNLVFMILGGFLTGGAGIVFVVGAFIFAFFLISLTIRAMHIFLLSVTSVVILMFVSPITITLGMFNRTNGIFKSWLKQLAGFTLQPMILFAYLGILITLFDKIVIGDNATFNGNGRETPKEIVCNSLSNNDSIYCIFKIAKIKTLTGLEVIGIGLPALTDMNADKIQTIIKAAMIMFIFAKFMDQISDFASKLVGGAALKSDWNVSTSSMAGSAYSALRGVQKRGMGAGKKVGGKVARKAVEAVRAIGNKGKAINDKRLGQATTNTKAVEQNDNVTAIKAPVHGTSQVDQQVDKPGNGSNQEPPASKK